MFRRLGTVCLSQKALHGPASEVREPLRTRNPPDASTISELSYPGREQIMCYFENQVNHHQQDTHEPRRATAIRYE